MKTILRKIPGVIPPPPKSEIDGKLTDLTSKTIPELLDLRERQLKLLKNKAFISKLPDGGIKIRALLEKINAELRSKYEEENTCRLLKDLNLSGDTIQHVEWEGKIKKISSTPLDSDDDSDPEDVLHILSKSTTQEKIVKVQEPEKLLISPQDLEKIGEIPHVKYIVDKTENKPTTNTNTGQFKPYKTTKSDVHNPEKEICRKRNKHWEVTAATPPPIVHGPAKVLPIEESLKLQKDYNRHLKEVEAQHAAEKLIARMGVKMGQLPDDVRQLGKYRDVATESEESDPEGSDKEIHDEEPERGGVVFTVMK